MILRFSSFCSSFERSSFVTKRHLWSAGRVWHQSLNQRKTKRSYYTNFSLGKFGGSLIFTCKIGTFEVCVKVHIAFIMSLV